MYSGHYAGKCPSFVKAVLVAFMRTSNVLYMQIAKELVDKHHSERQTVPHCELVATWLKREQQVKPLVHTVNILGTTEDDDYFTINIHPGNYIDKIFGGWLEVCS